VPNTPESSLVPIMENIAEQFSDLKLFSLPHLGEETYIELGFRGEKDLDLAMQALIRALREHGFAFEKTVE
jgi:hypothetical protein